MVLEITFIVSRKDGCRPFHLCAEIPDTRILRFARHQNRYVDPGIS